MKVLFIWIENYKGLSNLGLNFSNEYNISFNKDTNTLSIEDNEDYIEGFFGEKISNLTAIVGKNGVGKSSIISFWTNYLISGNGAVPSDESFILYTKDTDDLHLCCAKDKPLIEKKTSKLLNIDNKWPKCDLVVNISSIIDASSPFAKNSFYETGQQEELAGQVNLTSYYLLASEPNHDTNSHPFKTHFNSFTTEEYKRIVSLVQYSVPDQEENLQFKSVKLPKYLKLDLQLVNDSSITIPSPQKSNPFEKFILNLYRVYFEGIIKTGEIFDNENMYLSADIKHKGQLKDSYQQLINIFNSEPNDSSLSIIDQIKEKTKQLTTVDTIYSNLKTNIATLNKLVEKLSTIDDGSYNVHEELTTSITLLLNKSTHGDVNEILDYLNQFDIPIKSHTLTFCHDRFGGTSLSSGEYQLLSMLGRLNSVLKNMNKCNSLTILLDEIDICLHPQWQKEVIKHLFDFINENEAFARQTIQGEKVNKPFIQLIITSHSPFVLSDIPKNCVLLLDKKDDKVIIKSLQKSHNTFGMNIHELFTDSFFLQDGLMGEFARTEIHKLIERINNEKEPITADLYEDYKKRIKIIGEPFLRKKIMELLLSKSTSTSQKYIIDEMIRQKEKELENLKRLKNND